MNDIHPAALNRLEKKIDELSDAVLKLILLEERQITQAARLTAIEKYVNDVEKTALATEKKLDQWINRGVGIWAVAMVGASFVGFFVKLAK